MTGYTFLEFEVPERMMRALDDYCTLGHLPGDFLQAVISNDLAEACGRADHDNLRNLPAFVAYLWNEAPAPCWGSKEKMNAWVKHMAEQRELARTK